jgi:hypothetical protein
VSRVSAQQREAVRQRANDRCEYCRLPERASLHSHHVDHIISQKHDGSDELDNLAWACLQCNVNKSSDVAAYDRETGELTPLFNPRTQEWSKHFEMDDRDGEIVGKTPVGRVTIRLLQINHPDQIIARRLLIEAEQ